LWRADLYEVSFHEDRAEIIRRDGSITTTMDVAVSPEDDAEVRRVSVTNHGSRAREIELTSYAETNRSLRLSLGLLGCRVNIGP
jgi:cyclic beta-1,2-glucan synthetase